jgi:hypothetical protein
MAGILIKDYDLIEESQLQQGKLPKNPVFA